MSTGGVDMPSDCDVTGEELSAHIDGELAPADAARVERHLAACAACRARFEALDRAAGAVATLGAALAPASARPEGDGRKEGDPTLARFLARLDVRIAAELAADPRMARAARPGRYAPRRAPSLSASFFRVAAAAAIAILALQLYGLIAHERGGAPPAVEPPPREPDRMARAPLDAAEKLDPRSGESFEAARGVEGETAKRPPLPPAPPAPAPRLAAAPPAPAPSETGGARLSAAPPSPGAAAAARPLEPALDERARARLVARELDIARRDGPLADREAAVYELARLGGADAAAFFREALGGRSPRLLPLERAACRALAAYPSRGGTLALIDAARGPRGAEPRAALAALAAKGALGWLREDAEARQKLALAPEVRLLVGEELACARAAGAEEFLRDALALARDREERARLLVALGAAGGDGARATLARAAVESPDAAIRAAACRGLARAGGPGAETEAIERLLARDPSPLVRAWAATALGAAAAQAGETLARAAASDPAPAVRAAAAAARERLAQRAGTAARPARAAVAAAPADFWALPVVSEGTVFLLDASSSMRASGAFARAAAELEATLRRLAPGTPFVVGVFAEDVRFHATALERATPAAVEGAIRFLRGPATSPAGRTNIGAALRKALDLPGADLVIVATDGAPTAGPDAESLLEWLRGRNWDGAVRLHVVGLFDGARAPRLDDPAATGLAGPGPIAFLRRLAEDNGGLFLRND